MRHWTCLEAMTGCVITSVVMVSEHVNNDVFISYSSVPLLSEALLRARRHDRHCV